MKAVGDVSRIVEQKLMPLDMITDVIPRIMRRIDDSFDMTRRHRYDRWT